MNDNLLTACPLFANLPMLSYLCVFAAVIAHYLQVFGGEFHHGNQRRHISEHQRPHRFVCCWWLLEFCMSPSCVIANVLWGFSFRACLSSRFRSAPSSHPCTGQPQLMIARALDLNRISYIAPTAFTAFTQLGTLYGSTLSSYGPRSRICAMQRPFLQPADQAVAEHVHARQAESAVR